MRSECDEFILLERRTKFKFLVFSNNARHAVARVREMYERDKVLVDRSMRSFALVITSSVSGSFGYGQMKTTVQFLLLGVHWFVERVHRFQDQEINSQLFHDVI